MTICFSPCPTFLGLFSQCVRWQISIRPVICPPTAIIDRHKAHRQYSDVADIGSHISSNCSKYGDVRLKKSSNRFAIESCKEEKSKCLIDSLMNKKLKYIVVTNPNLNQYLGSRTTFLTSSRFSSTLNVVS